VLLIDGSLHAEASVLSALNKVGLADPSFCFHPSDPSESSDGLCFIQGLAMTVCELFPAFVLQRT